MTDQVALCPTPRQSEHILRVSIWETGIISQGIFDQHSEEIKKNINIEVEQNQEYQLHK